MAAGKFGGQSSGLLVDGYNLLSAKLKGLRYTIEALTEDTTGLGDSWTEHTPVGLSKVEVVQDGGFFDTNTAGSHAALSGSVPTSPQATVRVMVAWFGGSTIGAPFIGIQGAYTQQYSVLAENEKLTKANASYLVSGQIDQGVILNALGVKTIDWNTKTDGASVDYTLDTTQKVIPITSNSQASPTVVTTTIPHGLVSGDIILIAGVATSDATINGQRVATVISTTTFSVPVDASIAAGTGGSFVRADSPGGGVGYQEVVTFTGFSAFVGTIKDSPDDITYASLIAFASVAAIGAERATVAGEVDRYLSFDGNVTGAGTISVFAGFSRTL